LGESKLEQKEHKKNTRGAANRGRVPHLQPTEASSHATLQSAARGSG